MTISKPFAIILSVILSCIVLGLGFSMYQTANTRSSFTDFADELEAR
jgi:hypothetical protein